MRRIVLSSSLALSLMLLGITGVVGTRRLGRTDG